MADPVKNNKSDSGFIFMEGGIGGLGGDVQAKARAIDKKRGAKLNMADAYDPNTNASYARKLGFHNPPTMKLAEGEKPLPHLKKPERAGSAPVRAAGGPAPGKISPNKPEDKLLAYETRGNIQERSAANEAASRKPQFFKLHTFKVESHSQTPQKPVDLGDVDDPNSAFNKLPKK